MDVVTVRERPPALRRPVLIAAFDGWNDAGEAATGALDAMATALEATAFADVDPEDFFDFQATRPTTRLVDGRRRLEWPTNRFSWASPQTGDRDVVVLAGTEPNLRWRAFAGGVLDLAERLGVSAVVTLGALQVDVPHTRPVPVTGVAGDAATARRLGLVPSRYEGPTGIVGVLNSLAHERGLPSLSVWAGVPHYLSGAQYLPGALAIADRVARLLDVDVALEGLASAAMRQRDEIARVVASDDDLTEYVEELERRGELDLDGDDEPDDEPDDESASVADEVERFLRDRRDDR